MMRQRRNLPVVLMVSAVASALTARPAAAVDEIQVYNAEIAEVGQWTIEQHLNFRRPEILTDCRTPS